MVPSVLGLAVSITTGATAGFTGWSASFTDQVDGRRTYQVFANFSGGTTHSLLNCYGYQSVAGTMGAWHSGASGELNAWNPAATTSEGEQLGDSFVTATGSIGGGTGISIGDGDGSSLPTGSGWYAVGAAPPINGSLRVMQITRTGAAVQSGDFELFLRLSYKVTGTTTTLFGDGQVVLIGVPAPGALALACFALPGSRRRMHRA